MSKEPQFDPVNLVQMKLVLQLPPHKRVRLMLEARELADLVPLTMSPTYRLAFQRRVRQRIKLPNAESLEVWCARPEDVIVGKLKAWAEGRSRKHETDIYQMMVLHYLGHGATLSATLDEGYVDVEAAALGLEVAALWQNIKQAAQRQAHRGMA